MPRIYERRLDAMRATLTVPLTERALERLRRFAVCRGWSAAAAARELIERGIRAEGDSRTEAAE